jgi:Mrp family chromosome partitioning ATPase
MSDVCRFDDSLPRLLRILSDKLGPSQAEAGVVLRDATGRLCFFANVDVDPAMVREIDELVRASLGPYARPDRLLVGAGEPGARRVLQDPDVLAISVAVDKGKDVTIRYLDRRIVGADWLRLSLPPAEPTEGGVPSPERPNALRVAFSSLKGGVGRSTALTVMAAEQARRGRNVLVIDLDLEAPGIGSLLLSEDRMPSFGVIDYLVERNFGAVDRAVVDDMVGTSALTQGQGLVSVVPAVGSRTLQAPGNYLAKVSRAMIEAVVGDDGPVSLAAKLREMLNDLEALRRYDLVLIDVRAGLAELAAGPLLALDAEVLIFGAAQRQTIQDLHFLFAHLATLTSASDPAHWRRIKMVHAKAAQASAKDFRDELWELFATYLYVEAIGLDEFNFDADDPDAPHYPIEIRLDTAFADWDPVSHPETLVESYYSRTFGELITHIDDLLSLDQDDVQD